MSLFSFFFFKLIPLHSLTIVSRLVCCCFRKEKAHDEADSSAHSMIGGVTEEEEEVEGKICFLNQVHELKMELETATSRAETNRSMEELQKARNEKIQEWEKATNEKIQELEAKVMMDHQNQKQQVDTFAASAFEKSTRNFRKRESIKHPWIRRWADTFPQVLPRRLLLLHQLITPRCSCQIWITGKLKIIHQNPQSRGRWNISWLLL